MTIAMREELIGKWAIKMNVIRTGMPTVMTSLNKHQNRKYDKLIIRKFDKFNDKSQAQLVYDGSNA